MKIVKIAAGVVVALIVVVVIVLMTVDVNKYKGAVQAQVKSATGRDIAIGDMKLSISLSPAIVLSDVSLANAPWGTRPQMLTLKKLEAHTQLVPLLFGTVNISGLKMTGADAYLETDPNGKGNWEFDTAKDAKNQPQSGGSSQAMNVSGVSFEGLKLAYKDGKTKEAATIGAKTLDIELEGAITDLAISSLSASGLIADFKQGTKSGSGTVGKLSMAATGPITDFNITNVSVSDAKGAYADGPMIYDGAIGSLAMEGAATKRTPAKPGQQLDVVAALKAMNVTKFTVEKATANAKDGKTTTTAEIGKIAVDAKGKIGDLGISNLSVTETKIAMKGDGAPLDVAVDKLTLDDKGALTLAAKVSGQDVKANGTLAPVAALASMNKGFPAKVVIEGMGLKVNTDVTVDVSKKRPMAKGTVNIPELDLAAFAKSSGAQSSAPAKGATASGPMFSNDPLPWESLESADADVKVTIDKLTLPSGLVLTKVSVPVALNDGKLAVKPASFGVAGGTVSADLAMDAAAKSLALTATAKGITAETIAKEMKKGDLITQGPIDLDVNVRGSGASPHAIATNLSGSFLVGMGESKIRSDALNIVGADIIMQVLSAVNPVGNKDPYTVARCGVANFQIAGGVARTNNGIALVTDKMQLTSSGEINLGTEHIDLSVNPKATGGLGVGLGSIASAVRVTGPLASPGIGIDKAGAIKSIGTLGAAFATGGLSALAQGAKNRVEGGGDPCQTARTWTQKK